MKAADPVRHKRTQPCLICGGFVEAARGKDIRCFGFRSGDWVHCTREERAGGIQQNAKSQTFPHSLTGKCGCGASHGGEVRTRTSKVAPRAKTMTDTYDYRDQDGQLRYQVGRYAFDDNGEKTFLQRHTDGNGVLQWNLKGIERLPYLLPELLAALPGTTVFICEGEKDADQLKERGLIATCNSEGAGKFTPEIAHWFEGRQVVILEDNDEAGRKHVEKTSALLSGVAASLKVVTFKDMPDHSDVSDWLDEHHTIDDLRQLVDGLPEYTVPSETPQEWEPPVPFNETAGPPFPANVFPPQVEEFVHAVADAIQVPPDLPAVLALGVGAAACSGRAEVYLTPDWDREPLNDYYATVLHSGERKSEVFKKITAPIEEYEQELVETARPEIDQAAVEREIQEKRLAELKSQAAKAKGKDSDELGREAVELSRTIEEQQPLRMPRLLADDTTSEAITTLLVEQGGRTAIMGTEGGIFGIMAGRYSEGKGNFDIYMKGYTGDPVRIDRKGRGPEYIPRPLITFCVTVQPQVIEELGVNREFRGRGLLARYNYSIPANIVGYRKIRVTAVPEETSHAWSARIKDVLRLPDIKEGDEHRLTLTPEAAELFEQYREQVEIDLRPGGDLAEIVDWGNRLAGTVARQAGILHMLTHADNGAFRPWETPITQTTLDAAIRLGDYFKAHAQIAFAMMGEDQKLRKAKMLWASTERRGFRRFSERDLYQIVRRQFKNMADFRETLHVLVEMNYIRAIPVINEGLGGPGRTPSPKYEVNPLGRTRCTQNTQNTLREPISGGSVYSEYNVYANEDLKPAVGKAEFPSDDSPPKQEELRDVLRFTR